MIDYNDLYGKYSSKFVEVPDKSYNNILTMGRVNSDPRPYQHIVTKSGMPGLVQANVKQYPGVYDDNSRVASIPDWSGMNNSNQKVPDNFILAKKAKFMSPMMPGISPF